VDDFREERRARGAAGRQARPDLSLDKSGKNEWARHARPRHRSRITLGRGRGGGAGAAAGVGGDDSVNAK